MIRRNMQLSDGSSGWLLISQVEHAHLSGEIARVWKEPISDEVVAAISHHDDGWAVWEAAPQIDRRSGTPLSFMEMAITDSMAIWDRSIASASTIGPLAGAIVAGHFIGLTEGSEHASEMAVRTWLRLMYEKRAEWLDKWQRLSETNTLSMAENGQAMLLVADLLSLWLCCDGPVDADVSGGSSNTEMKSRSAMVLGKYRFETHSQSAGRAEIAWDGTLMPWPFSKTELQRHASAISVPAAKYDSWPQISAVCQPVNLYWRLRKTLSAHAEC